MKEDSPTIITSEDILNWFKSINNDPYPELILCDWCKCECCVREVGANYICEKCEREERKAGRPLVFTSPVSDCYMKLEFLKDG